MLKKYEKPEIQICRYEPSDSIASNCGTVINLGPEVDQWINGNNVHYDQCTDWNGVFGSSLMTASTYEYAFYSEPDICGCYLSSGNSSYATS